MNLIVKIKKLSTLPSRRYVVSGGELVCCGGVPEKGRAFWESPLGVLDITDSQERSFIFNGKDARGYIAQKYIGRYLFGVVPRGYAYDKMTFYGRSYCIYDVDFGGDKHYLVFYHNDEIVATIVIASDEITVFTIEDDVKCLSAIITYFFYYEAAYRPRHITKNKKLKAKFDASFVDSVVLTDTVKRPEI